MHCMHDDVCSCTRPFSWEVQSLTIMQHPLTPAHAPFVPRTRRATSKRETLLQIVHKIVKRKGTSRVVNMSVYAYACL
jgi:hypothetical protein